MTPTIALRADREAGSGRNSFGALCTAFGLALLSAMGLGVPEPALAQEAGWQVTDDPRRVPLPPEATRDDRVLVIEGGTLIDGTADGEPTRNAVVVLGGDEIRAAGTAADVEIPDDPDRVIDASGLYVLPGLIDLHIHFTQQRGEDFSRYRDSDAAAAIRGTLLAEQLIEAGVTAVREVGTRGDVGLKIKEAVARGMIDGPRVFWSGQLIAARGGHGDEITSTATGRPKSMETSARVRVATGPWEWRLAVREQIRRHADWIKLTAPYTREEVGAAVDEAHQRGYPVTVDSFGKYTAWAAELGMDSIEHPLDLSEEVIAAMAEHGTDLVPTLTAFYNPETTGYPSAGIPPGGFYYTLSRRFPVKHEQHLEMVGKAHAAGIRIGVGTDIPFENETRYPGAYFRELGFLKEAGLSDREVLAAATRVGAQIARMGDKLGTLEPGKLADILIVAGNPLEDIQTLRKTRYVIGDGRVVHAKSEED